MPHVQLTTNDSGNAATLIVDGVDMTEMVMRNGFSITMKDHLFTVSLRLVPSALDVDLPDCVVSAVRESTPHTRICKDPDNHSYGCDCGGAK